MSADKQMIPYPPPQEQPHPVARIVATVLLCTHAWLLAVTHGIACFNYNVLYSIYVGVIQRSLQKPFDFFVPCQILSEDRSPQTS